MQVEIYIQGRPYSMLIDSGSSHYFLNAKFQERLPGAQPLQPVTVKIADGASLQCDKHLTACNWQYGQDDFTSQYYFLSLGHYDGILGLASLGTTSVDWGN
jgi:hypothetical protein